VLFQILCPDSTLPGAKFGKNNLFSLFEMLLIVSYYIKNLKKVKRDDIQLLLNNSEK